MRVELPPMPDPRPFVDERLVGPEQRYEAHEGRLVYVSPADEPHGTRHSELMALLEAHAAEHCDVACDMLTRTSELDDIAPDASVFPRDRDPRTGGRQLEELAFEVVSTSGLAKSAVKAERLVERGVRRVFAIDVKRQRLLEWSRDSETWQILPHQGKLTDPALAVPLPIPVLVGAASTDDAVAQALLSKQNPVLVAAVAASKAEGKAEGKAEDVLAVLTARGLTPSPVERARLLAERDLARLERWLTRAVTVAAVGDLFEG